MMREMTDGAREIAQFNLPVMDGTHECIPRLALGQHFFEGFFRPARSLERHPTQFAQNVFNQRDMTKIRRHSRFPEERAKSRQQPSLVRWEHIWLPVPKLHYRRVEIRSELALRSLLRALGRRGSTSWPSGSRKRDTPAMLMPLASRCLAVAALGLTSVSSNRKTLRKSMKTKGIATRKESLPEIRIVSSIRPPLRQWHA
jgi:hypothetical protein